LFNLCPESRLPVFDLILRNFATIEIPSPPDGQKRPQDYIVKIEWERLTVQKKQKQELPAKPLVVRGSENYIANYTLTTRRMISYDFT
jgi:hypothetical protein